MLQIGTGDVSSRLLLRGGADALCMEENDDAGAANPSEAVATVTVLESTIDVDDVSDAHASVEDNEMAYSTI